MALPNKHLAGHVRPTHFISTRISGRRTAPFPPFLNPHRAPHGVTPRSSYCGNLQVVSGIVSATVAQPKRRYCVLWRHPDSHGEGMTTILAYDSVHACAAAVAKLRTRGACARVRVGRRSRGSLGMARGEQGHGPHCCHQRHTRAPQASAQVACSA